MIQPRRLVSPNLARNLVSIPHGNAQDLDWPTALPPRRSRHQLDIFSPFSPTVPHASPHQPRLAPHHFMHRRDHLPLAKPPQPTQPQPHSRTAGSQSITQAFTMSSITREEVVRKSWGSSQEVVVHIPEPFPFNTVRSENDNVRRLSSTFTSSPCCRKSSSTPKYTAFAHRSKNPAT